MVQMPDVAFDKRSPYIGFVRGDVYFKDGSRLHFRELINLQLDARPSVYVYHYQRADGSLVFRYDNAPHFPALENFPHHKHHLAEANVVSATAPDLRMALEEIELHLK